MPVTAMICESRPEFTLANVPSPRHCSKQPISTLAILMSSFRGANIEKQIPRICSVHRKVIASRRTYSSHTARNLTVHLAACAPDENTDTAILTNWPPAQPSTHVKTRKFQPLRHHPNLAERRQVSIRDDSLRRMARVFARQLAPFEERQHYDRDCTASCAVYSASFSVGCRLKHKQC